MRSSERRQWLVGRELCRLLRDDHQVAVLDNFRHGFNRFRPEERTDIEFMDADIRNPRIAHDIASFAPDTIVHLAAIHFIPECERDPLEAVATNVLGTVNMLTACPVGARFVFASSAAVCAPSLTPHREATSALAPENFYGFTKAEGEDYVRYLTRVRRLRAVVVRLFNVVGPGETNPHVLPEIVTQLKAGHRTLHLGNLEPRRDYVRVRDAAAGFMAVAVGQPPSFGETVIVNLGTSRTHSVRELVGKLACIANLDIEVECDPARMRTTDRPFLAADISTIYRLFRWKPQFDIDDAIRELWEKPDLLPELTRTFER